MNTISISVQSTLGPVQAELVVCECNGEVFMVFTVEGHDHFHFQCSKCEVSFCPAGRCSHPADKEKP